MIYFTGSKAHNIRIREMAVRKGLKLNEYGLFQAKSGKLIVAETEEEVYERLGLPWIAPTLREDRGEVEARLAGTLPEAGRSSGSSGATCTPTPTSPTGWRRSSRCSRRPPPSATRTTPSPITPRTCAMQRMTDEKMLAQRDAAARAAGPRSRRCGCSTAPSSTSIPTAAWTGTSDVPGGLRRHGGVGAFALHASRARSMTRRVIRAIEHPHVNIIGHLTGRKIGRRRPDRPRPRGGLRGGGADRHGARDQLLPRPARPDGRARAVGAAPRGEVRDRYRLACRRAPRHDALRRRRPRSEGGSRRTT